MSGILPDDDTALQFAIMVQAGLPAIEAIAYFVETENPQELGLALDCWQKSPKVRAATLKLMGKAWHLMTTDERMKLGLDLLYSQYAYLLYSRNYLEAGDKERAKMDEARKAIEAKLAGQAGRGDQLSQFFEDVRTGRVKLNPVVPRLN